MTIDHPNMDNLVKRWGERSENLVKFLASSPKEGDIFVQKNKFYNPNVQASFGNERNRNCAMTLGTTHVSVGLADLGVLLTAVLIQHPKKEQKSLRFQGYDSSAYAVAKSRIIVEMINQNCEAFHVLQVWWSSTWTAETLKNFRNAAKSLSVDVKDEVGDIIKFWSKDQSDLPASAALDEWFKSVDPSSGDLSVLFNFSRAADRVDFARYALTGSLTVSGKPADQYANATMFHRPPGVLPRPAMETIYHMLPFNEMILSPEFTETRPPLMKFILEWTIDRIDRLIGWIRNGQIFITIHHATLSPKSPIVREIAEMAPYTIHWSNLCDYIKVEDFHLMAKACSSPETVHYLYTMNWTQEVFGTSALDFENTKATMNKTNGIFASIWNLTGQNIYWGIFMSKLVEHPLNTSDYMLARQRQEDWFNKNFFRSQKTNFSMQNVEHDYFSPSSRTHVTIHFAYSYDSNLQFQY
eukprot:TRINITY_DN10513_c0_g1_i1.p1 TRINITY_DN10513_c0_g1~~TRINITY_DN10513_c0_g1_i1.p1  ORF type:complete len:468 (+),score=108.09 TRINITY_DN10513_c0_g1_i1:342-1745(+)